LWVLNILFVEKINMKKTWSIYSNSALFFPKFWAKIMLVVAILHVKTIEMKIMNTYLIYLKSTLFSLKFWARINLFLAISSVKKNIKIKKPKVFNHIRNFFLQNFELKYWEFWLFCLKNNRIKIKNLEYLLTFENFPLDFWTKIIPVLPILRVK
jgi:hypothetical protein